jgi:hypothetical protein
MRRIYLVIINKLRVLLLKGRFKQLVFTLPCACINWCGRTRELDHVYAAHRFCLLLLNLFRKFVLNCLSFLHVVYLAVTFTKCFARTFVIDFLLLYAVANVNVSVRMSGTSVTLRQVAHRTLFLIM